MTNLEIIKNQMGPVSIDNNYRKNSNWGILFNTVNSPEGFEWGVPSYPIDAPIVERDEAWVVGESFMCRWTDFGRLDYNKELPFLNFEETRWTHNTISASIDATSNKIIITPSILHERLERVRPKTQAECEAISSTSEVPFTPGANIKIKIPFGNLYNLLAQYETKQQRDRVRIVIKSNREPMNDLAKGATLLITEMHPIHGIVMKIWEPAREKFFPHISADKFYIVASTSPCKIEDMAPGQMYQCFFSAADLADLSIEDQMELSSTVEARYRLFKGIEIMHHTSTSGFLLDESIQEVVDAKRYKDKDVLRVPYINPFEQDQPIDPEYFNFAPIHLDCNALFNILDLYRGFEWIEFNVSSNPNHPILINGVKPSVEYPTIQSVITTLRCNKGDIR